MTQSASDLTRKMVVLWKILLVCKKELQILLAFPGQYTEVRFTLGMLNESLISTTGLRLLENMDWVNVENSVNI